MKSRNSNKSWFTEKEYLTLDHHPTTTTEFNNGSILNYEEEKQRVESEYTRLFFKGEQYERISSSMIEKD